MKIITLFTTTIILLFGVGKANAAYNCYEGITVRDAYINGSHIINIPFDSSFIGNLKTIKATSSVPIGMYINNNGKDFNSQCAGMSTTNPLIGAVQFKYRYGYSENTSQAPKISNITGVSYYVRFVGDSCPTCSSSNNFPDQGELARFTFGASNETGMPGQYTLTLIKTGNVLQSGYIDKGVIATIINRNAASAFWALTSRLNINPNSIYINVLNCSLKQSTYNINMGDWYDTQFKNINDTQGTVDIPITLSCMSGTNIKVTVTSDTIDNAANGRLGLTGADKATGIAVQLLNNAGTPIVLGQKFTQQDGVPQGDYIFGWKARYIKTANTVTPGTANANATVNIRYE